MMAICLIWRILTIDFFFTNSYSLEAYGTAFASASFVETESETASALGGLTPCHTYCNLYEVSTSGVFSNFLDFHVFSFFLQTNTYDPRKSHLNWDWYYVYDYIRF
jgi:hypothetical protein